MQRHNAPRNGQANICLGVQGGGMAQRLAGLRGCCRRRPWAPARARGKASAQHDVGAALAHLQLDLAVLWRDFVKRLEQAAQAALEQAGVAINHTQGPALAGRRADQGVVGAPVRHVCQHLLQQRWQHQALALAQGVIMADARELVEHHKQPPQALRVPGQQPRICDPGLARLQLGSPLGDFVAYLFAQQV